jgi:hypothetical protein
VGDQSKEDEIGRTLVHKGELRNAYIIFIGKPEGKISLGRHRLSWEDIRKDLRELGGRVWTGFVWLMIEISVRPL